MRSTLMLFTLILIAHIFLNHVETNAKELELVKKSWHRNDTPWAKLNNVYDKINVMGKHLVKMCVQRVLDGTSGNIDVDAMNSLVNQRVDTEESVSCIDMVDSTGWIHKGARMKRGLTRKQTSERASEKTPKMKRKLAKKIETTVFEIEKPFDVAELEGCLNEDVKSMFKTEEEVKRQMKFIQPHSSLMKHGRTNETGPEGNITVPTHNKTHVPSDRTKRLNKKPKHKTENIAVKTKKREPVDQKSYYDASSQYYSTENSDEYGMSSEKNSDWISHSVLAYEDDIYDKKVAQKKHRQKRAVKKGGKKKGGGRDRGFDFGFGKKKGYQSKANQGKRKGGGGWGAGAKKKGKGGGGGKKKRGGSDDSSDGMAFDFEKMFEIVSGDDSDYDDDDEEYDIDSEEELSHHGGGRGGRTNHKGNKNKNKNNNQNKQQGKYQNRQQSEQIVREKLTIMEIKDDDNSILHKRNVHVISNKKESKTQRKQEEYWKKKQQQTVYVKKQSIQYLEYLNDSKIEYGNRTYFGIKIKSRKSNRSTIHRRVKRSAKKLPKRAKKAKPKNTKRNHKGKDKKNKEKKRTGDKITKKKSISSDSGHISREKLTITEVKSGEDQDTKDKKKDNDSEESSNSKKTEDSDELLKKQLMGDKFSDETKSSVPSDIPSEVLAAEAKSHEKRKKLDSGVDSSKSQVSVPSNLVPATDASNTDTTLKTGKNHDEINKALGVNINKLKEKYEVDSEELRDEVKNAKKFFEAEKKKAEREKEKKTEDKEAGKKVTAKKKKGRREPPPKYTTKKRREPKKVLDYSAEFDDKDKELKDGIKTIIRELNGELFYICSSGKT